MLLVAVLLLVALLSAFLVALLVAFFLAAFNFILLAAGFLGRSLGANVERENGGQRHQHHLLHRDSVCLKGS